MRFQKISIPPPQKGISLRPASGNTIKLHTFLKHGNSSPYSHGGGGGGGGGEYLYLWYCKICILALALITVEITNERSADVFT